MSIEIISTVLIAATASGTSGAYDLTDLATVHDELSLPTTDTSNDPFLQRAITQASSAIANYCNRVFPVEALQDLCYIQQDPYPWQNPAGVDPLQLSRWPLPYGAVVNFTGNTYGTTTIDTITQKNPKTGVVTSGTVGILKGALVFAADGSIPVGTTVTAVNSTSIALSQAATSSVTGQTLNTGVQVIQTLSAGGPPPSSITTQTLVYGQDYTVDAVRGWLIRLDQWTGVEQTWESVPTQVQYQAGYPTPLPPDLVEACLRMVTARFRARGRDPMLVARDQPQSLGSERYWVGSAPGQVGTLPPEVVGLLSSYRVPVTA